MKQENAEARVARAIAWCESRLVDCEKTRRNNMVRQSRDWAYGEAVAIRAILRILNGEVEP